MKRTHIRYVMAALGTAWLNWAGIDGFPSSCPAQTTPAPAVQPVTDPVASAQAIQNPVTYLKECLSVCRRDWRDYTCTLRRREFIDGRFTPEQVMEVMFREKPWSVRLEWKEGAINCARVLYVADRWVEDGHPMAVVEPVGRVARLFVSYVMKPIDGEEARRHSRKSLTDFGFRRTLETLVGRCGTSTSQQAGVRFSGYGSVDGRRTLIFDFDLGTCGSVAPGGERWITAEIDETLRVPVRCTIYADTQRRQMLGRYEFTRIRQNPGIPEREFTLAAMGLE